MDSNTLLKHLVSESDIEARYAVLAEFVIDKLPLEIAEVARKCAVLPWFTEEIISSLYQSENSTLDDHYVISSVVELPFVEEVSEGFAFHSGTRKALIRKYSVAMPEIIVESYRKSLSVFKLHLEENNYALIALIGLIIVGEREESEALLDDLYWRLILINNQSKGALLFKSLEEVENMSFVPDSNFPANYWLLNGISLAQRWKTDRAIYYIEKAVHFKPDDLTASVLLGELKARRGGFAEALDIFNKITKITESTFLLQALATTYHLMGDTRKAIRYVSRAISRERAEHADGYLLPMLYMQRGELYDSLDNHDMAIGDYGRAIDLSPERPDIYLWRGSLYLLKKNYTNAIEDLNKVVEMAPELKTRILPLRAKVHRLKGELQLALQDIDLSLELDRKNEMAIFERIMILFETKDYEEARKACLEFLDLYPEDETIYSILAQISGKQGMHGEAEAYFYKASELSEDTPEFLYRLVEVIHEYYDYVDVAINLLKKYIALRPNDSKGYNALGFYYIVDGNLKEAQLVLEKSLDIETSSIGLINLSVVKWLMNDIGQAQKSLREALKISGKTHYRKKGNIRRPSVFIEGWINIMLGNKTNGLMIMNETIQKESIWFLHNTEVWSKAVIEKGDSTPDGLTEALEMIQRMINQKKER